MPSPNEEKVPLLSIEDGGVDVLEYRGHFSPIHEAMGFKQLTFETAYQEFICNQFDNMKDDTRYKHLNALALYWQKLKSAGRTAKDFLDFLRGQALIRPQGKGHNLVIPEDAYSPRETLFHVFKPDRLIPDCFLSNVVLMIFLEELGVKTKVGRLEVLEFSRKIEKEERFEDTLRELFKEAFSVQNTSEPDRKIYLQQLGNIKFIPQIKTKLHSLIGTTKFKGMYEYSEL